MSMLSSSSLAVSAVAPLALAAAGVASGQTQDPPGDDARRLEEIIVTAQRRESTLGDVPVAVTAFDRSEIDALALVNVAQVAQYTPNVVWDQNFFGSANFSSIFIRGVGQLANFFESSADPSVAVYLDGVYIGRALGSVLGLHDVAQVEVLRGPQGTLFGRNATGGAVTISTTRPGDSLDSWVDVTVGSDNRLDGKAVVNVPVTDTLFGRISASSLNQDGYGESLIDGTEFGDTNIDTALASVRWLATNNLTLDFSLDWNRSRQGAAVNTLVFADPGPMSLSGAYNFFVAPTNTVEGFGNGIPFDDRFITDSNFTNYATWPSGSELDTFGVAAVVDWQSRNISLKSITSYREMDSSWAADVDGSPIALIHDAIATDQDQFSQEITLRGVHNSLDWLVGLYYFEEEATGFSRVFLVPELLETPEDPVFGTPNPFFGQMLGANGPNPPVTAESAAVFAHIAYDFGTRWRAFAGLRYTDEDKGISDPGTGLVASGSTSASFSESTPSVGVQFFAADDTQLYVTVSEGFKSGGFNTIVVMPRENYLAFEPEQITSYEVGAKIDRDRFRLSAAAFFADYEDIQLSVFNFSTPEFRNAAEAEIRGVEVEFGWAITDALQLHGGLGYLDAEYKSLDESVLEGLTVPVTLASSFPNAPEWSGHASIRYAREISGLGALGLRADYAWQDETFNDAPNTPEIAQEAFGTLYAAVTLTSLNGRWRIMLFGENLTDEEYLTNGNSNKPGFGIATGNFARARNWGLSLRYRFGDNR